MGLFHLISMVANSRNLRVFLPRAFLRLSSIGSRISVIVYHSRRTSVLLYMNLEIVPYGKPLLSHDALVFFNIPSMIVVSDVKRALIMWAQSSSTKYRVKKRILSFVPKY